MKYIIIANGILVDGEKLLRLVNQADVVVCADGGAKHLKRFNIIPDVIIGDMDSIEESQLNQFKDRAKLIKYPPKKDATDTELAIFWAIDQGAKDITLIGVTGTRMDHTLSNIFLLRAITKKGVSCKIVDDYNEIYLLSDETHTKKMNIGGKKGDLLSIIPITKEVTGLTLTGLEYPLNGATLKLGTSRGVSNIFTAQEEPASISLEHGIALIIKSCD
ncbi:MAG: thiamine diphosphokinase [Desulfamplus sp.]|nr:thiamine diphosphokinase [Desulfamplus sp.]